MMNSRHFKWSFGPLCTGDLTQVPLFLDKCVPNLLMARSCKYNLEMAQIGNLLCTKLRYADVVQIMGE